MSTFPDADLELTARAAFGADLTADPETWDWTDLSDRLTGTPITISWGVLVGSGNSRTASAPAVQLTNEDGALTPHHPGSEWWPYVDAGTPFDLAIRTNISPLLQDNFGRTTSNGFGTADTGQVWAGGTLSAFATNGSAATITISATNTFRHHRAPVTHRDIDVTVDVSVSSVALTAAHVFGLTVRGNSGGSNYIFPEIEFGLGGIIQCTLRTSQASVLTGLAQVTQSGLTYTAGTVIRFRMVLIGDRIRQKAWLASGTEPNAWTVDYTLDLGSLTLDDTHLGVVGWVLPGNTNVQPTTFTVDNLVVQQPKYPRIEGFIADVKPTFQPLSDGTTWSTVQVDIGGVGTILERRTADPWSPLRRSIQYGATTPDDYWPLEDQEGSLTAVSAWPDRPAMVVTGPVVFGFDTGEPDTVLLARYGTKSLCSVAAGAKLSSTVSITNSGSWTVSVTTNVFSRAVTPVVGEIRILEWTTPSSTTWNRWALICTATGHVIRAYNDATPTTSDVVTVVDAFAALITYDVIATQNGGNIDVTLMYNASTFGTGSVAGTVAKVTRIAINPDRANTTGSTDPLGIRYLVGHLSVRDVAAGTTLPYYVDSGTTYRADQGWFEEPTHLRAARIASEARVAFRQIGDVDSELWTRLNAQQEGGTVDLVKAAVDADSGGILYEDGFGWALVPRAARYNAGVDLTVDLSTYCRSDGTAQTDVLVPQLELRAPNYITVERTGGGSRSYAADAAYLARRGTIPDKATLDLLEDDDCGPHAQWRVHRNVDGQGANYPGMSLDLAANPDLIDDWLLCRPGSRVQRTNQPTIAGLGTIDQVIDSGSETIGPKVWIASLDTSPAEVWQVGVYDDATLRYDSASTVLKTGVSSSATSLTFRTAHSGDLWSTTTTPYPVLISGELITVTAMGAASLVSGAYDQAATVTRSVNGVVKALDADAEIHVATPGRWAL